MIPGMQGIGKIPELRKRVLFTLWMLAVYRFGVFVSTPGIDVAALNNLFSTGDGTLFGLVNMFSGGALEQFSIFTLGIMPYISVSIIMQLLSSSVPALERLKKEGESGQRIITRYTRQFTILLALFQGYMIAMGLEGQGVVLSAGLSFRISTAITLAAGTAFIMWLGEQINEKGIGNGMSIVIFAGIVARMPETLLSTLVLARNQEVAPMTVLIVLAFCIFTIAGIVFVERSHRRVPIQYPRRMVGNKMAQAQTQYMPLKVNMAGVIPPIFASAFLVLPATIGSISTNETVLDIMEYLQPGSWVYSLIFMGLIIFFAFFSDLKFYKSINPVKILLWIWFITGMIILALFKTKLEVYILLVLTPGCLLMSSFIKNLNSKNTVFNTFLVIATLFNIFWFASESIRPELKNYFINSNELISILIILILITILFIVLKHFVNKIELKKPYYIFILTFFIAINLFYFVKIPFWENDFQISAVKNFIDKSGKKKIVYIATNYRHNPQFSFYFNGLDLSLIHI